MANAGHVRPKGASPLRVSLVPAFNACTARTGQHGPPLAFPSCNPPVAVVDSHHASASRPSNGAAANMEGFVKLKVKVGIPGPPEDSDVLITARASRTCAAWPARRPAVTQTPSTARTTPVRCRATRRSGSRTTGTRLPRAVDRTRRRSSTSRSRSPRRARTRRSTTIGRPVHGEHVRQRGGSRRGQGRQACRRRSRSDQRSTTVDADGDIAHDAEHSLRDPGNLHSLGR